MGYRDCVIQWHDARVQLTLADWLRRRRSELGLSIRKAAAKTVPPGSDKAAVHRRTWESWEHGVVPQSRHFDGIEHALRWTPGSVESILDGGEPEKRVRPDAYVDALTGQRYDDPTEQALWDLRLPLAQQYVREFGPDLAAQRGEEDAREHIRLYRIKRSYPGRVA